ncbi:hypothetical protein [Halomonas heilongjiangensis]|uniref:hypothetical protein n=1 Tax=Halomonas heilongjiangensis TaxID=1387883 RepID=UPI0011AEEC17|nr:hypothetical protein [Halomonas heilongjiangensis]
MSGLLRRLARQATGHALPRVHAPARLPYHAAPELLPEEVSSATTMAAAPARHALSEPGTPPPTNATVEASTIVGTTAPGATSLDTLPAPLIGEVPPVDRSDINDPAPTDAATPAPRQASPIQPKEAPGAVHTTTKGPNETPDSWIARIEPVSVASRVEAANTPTARAPSVMATSAFDTPYPPEPEWQAPSPPPEALLLPLVTSQLPPRSTAMAMPPVVADSPAEVHVHIGRIEVTTVQEPAPTKRPSKRGQPPMSLDEYLARRRGSRP